MLLLLLSTLAGCQIGQVAPTATPTAPTAAPTTILATLSPSVAASPTRAAAVATGTRGATVALPGTARPAPATRATVGTPPPAATRATVGTPPPAATRAAASVTPGASTLGVGGICAFEPPLGRDFATPPPAATVPPARPPTLGVPAAPAQTPPSIPLPNVAARYTLTVDQFNFVEGRLHTAQTVQVTNREGCALDRLFFSVTAARWGWFTLGGVTVAGEQVAATLDGTTLPVRLPQPLAAGATTEIGFDFRLDVGVAVDPYTPGGFPATTQSGDILRLAYWFPILSDDHQYPPFLDPPYTASADFTVTLTTPSAIVVAPTGTIADERANADGTITRRIEASNVRDFVLALSPNYQVVRRQTANGVMVEVFYSPQTFGVNAQRPEYVQQLVARTLDGAVSSVERLSALIGPYPYPTLRVVDGGATLQGGIEFPALIMVGMAVTSNNLIYHEVAHEWFYGLLGTRTQQDPWIDEGGATFLADYLNGTLAANPPPATSFAYPLDSPVWAVPSGSAQRNATTSIYTQGGAFYTLVMRQMSEEAFWGALQSVFREKRYGIITPRELLTAWQSASPTDLRPLFGRYLTYPWIGELTK